MENLIENQLKQTKKGDEDGEEKKKRPVIKSATDLQRLKLEKLMKNPDKPIIIPEAPREKDYMQTVPSFVRNVMGSSAGAGSGEFHVYRHLRRKEYARQKCIQAKSMREQLDDEYQSKLENNRLEAEAKTAKKRAKRLKKKQRGKKPRTQQETEKNQDKEESSDEDDDDEEEEQSVNNTAVEPANIDKETAEIKVETENSSNDADKTIDGTSKPSDEVLEDKEKVVQEVTAAEIVVAPKTETHVVTDSTSQPEAGTEKNEENKQ